jgi:N-methylhydantoinase B
VSAVAGIRQAQRAVDPITLSVVSGALESIVKEMSTVIEHTARSPVVSLSHDYSNAVYTVVNGFPEMVVQGQDQPCHLGGMLSSVKYAAQRFAGGVGPGDVIIGNDPLVNGTHLLDIDVIEPVFVEERLVAWTCSRVHEIDIGGPVPGGYNPSAQDIFAEGIRIPPLKFVEGGRMRSDLWGLLEANVRFPKLFAGDIGAQLAAVHTATRRVGALFARYGAEPVQDAMSELLDRAEREMRAQIARMPDGTYAGEQWIQDDGRGSGDLAVACRIEVSGDRLMIELVSPPQVSSYRNSYPGLTIGAVYYAIISAIEPGVPINEGLYRPLNVDLGPPRTMLNAEHPQACAMSTGDVWTVTFDAVCAAMSQVVPERACAGWTRVAIFEVAGRDPRVDEPYASLLNVALMGGAGAVHGHDGGGLWGVIPTGGAATTGDIEMLELRLPLHFFRHEFATDSASPGRWRGAPGAVLEFSAIDHEAILTHVGDGTKFPPPSRLGAGSARDGALRVHRKTVHHPDGGEEAIPLHSRVAIDAEDRVRVELPGGGGVGLVSQRSRESVLSDVEHGIVSVDGALADYGVTVSDGVVQI